MDEIYRLTQELIDASIREGGAVARFEKPMQHYYEATLVARSELESAFTAEQKRYDELFVAYGEACVDAARATALRSALARLHDWTLAQQGACVFSGDHPIVQAAAALAGAQGVGSWRTIETVPKDGREVILREGSRIGAACWIKWPDTYDSDGAPDGEGGEGWTVGYDGNEWRNPSGWQPMPSADGVREDQRG